jgi:small subunit ribosomal protein S3
VAEEKPKPLLGEADPEFEKLLDAEEEIDRLSRESSETERFRPGQGD